MKVVKKSNSKLKTAAVFLAGVAVATLGWWQSDRLNLAFGTSAGINQVIEGGEDSNFRKDPRRCSPTDRQEVIRKYDGCNVMATVTRCNPNRKYIMNTKTRSGGGMVSYSVPTKGAREEITYEKLSEEKKMDVKSEYDRTTQEIDLLKKSRSQSDLSKDKDYQDKIAYKKELEPIVRRCMPVQTIGKPVSTPVGSARPVAR